MRRLNRWVEAWSRQALTRLNTLRRSRQDSWAQFPIAYGVTQADPDPLGA